MYNPEIIHTLTAVNPYTPRAVHDCFGIDYNQPFFGAHIIGAFTVNKVLQQIRAAEIDPAEAVNIILIRTPGTWRGNTWQAVTIDAEGRFDIDNKDSYWNGNTTRRKSGFDYYYRKSDFNNDRKSGAADAVIISQRRENTRKPAPKEIDQNERHKIININLCRYSTTSNETYISRITLQRTTDAGTRFEIGNTGRVIYRGYWEPRTVEDAIDKSGYMVYDRRREWKRRARALREEREKAAANAADYSNQLAELDRLFQAKKEAAAAAILAANTYEEMTAAGKMVEDYKTGLKWAAYDIERVKDAAENKKFTSPEKARAAFESIRAKLDPASDGEEAKTA